MAVAVLCGAKRLRLMTRLPFRVYMASAMFAEVKPERIEEGAIGLANSSVCKSGNGARNESSGAKCAQMV